MWIFDIIIGNSDRHGGNVLIKGDTVHAIDHGFSIASLWPLGASDNEAWNRAEFLEKIRFENRRFYGALLDEQIPQELIESIKNFLERPGEQQILTELLEELYDERYASACLRRIKTIGRMLIESGRVIFPPDSYGSYIPIDPV